MNNIDFRKIKSAAPVILGILVLIFLWYKFETLEKEEEPVAVVEQTVEKPKDYVQRFSFLENFEGASKIAFTPNNEHQYEGKFSAFMAEENLYGPTYVYDSLALIKTLDEVEVSFFIFTEEEIKDLKLIVAVGTVKENYIYHAPPVPEIKELGMWVKRTMFFPIDKKLLATKEGPMQIGVYLMNEGKNEFCIDHLEVKMKSLK